MQSLETVIQSLLDEGLSNLEIVRSVLDSLDKINQSKESLPTSIVDWNEITVDIPDSCMCDLDELRDLSVIFSGMKYLVHNNFENLDSKTLSKYSATKFTSEAVNKSLQSLFSSLMLCRKASLNSKYREFSKVLLEFVYTNETQFRFSFLSYCFLSKVHLNSLFKVLGIGIQNHLKLNADFSYFNNFSKFFNLLLNVIRLDKVGFNVSDCIELLSYYYNISQYITSNVVDEIQVFSRDLESVPIASGTDKSSNAHHKNICTWLFSYCFEGNISEDDFNSLIKGDKTISCLSYKEFMTPEYFTLLYFKDLR